MNLDQVAQATVTLVAPFMPYLVDAAKEGSKKLAEVIAEKGGEASWHRAKEIWQRIKKRFGDDPEVKSAAMLVATQPQNTSYNMLLMEIIKNRLDTDQDFSQELVVALGGERSVQEIIATGSSNIVDAKQSMEGSGTQTTRADDNSFIGKVSQTKK